MAGSVGSEDGDVGFQIAPMVDVVFVLLLFFMASAGVQMVEKQLTVNLPGKSERHVEEPLFIDIAADGTVSLNNTVFGLPADKTLAKLKSFLREAQGEF